ncbi:MAG TPA: DUF87 domain-containing protein [bacterium]|nr:DUF87 domain-containing protein [bacterium]
MSENKSPMNKDQGQYRYFKRPSLHDPKNSGEQIFETPREDQVKGDVRLGYNNNSRMVFGILKKELVRHLLICGSSGAGKSNLLRVMQIELNRLKIPFMVFDTAKLGTRFLKHHMEELIILRWDKEFFINPLQPPPGVKLKEWLMVFSEITTEIFGLRTASKLYLTEFVQSHLFQKDESSELSDFPTMHDLNRELEKRLKTRIPINERGYINGIHSKVKAVCITLGEMINVREGLPIDELLKHPVCIELVGIKSSEIQYWIISIILAAIASYREARPMAFGSLRHVFFLDEASHIVGNGDA